MRLTLTYANSKVPVYLTSSSYPKIPSPRETRSQIPRMARRSKLFDWRKIWKPTNMFDQRHTETHRTRMTARLRDRAILRHLPEKYGSMSSSSIGWISRLSAGRTNTHMYIDVDEVPSSDVQLLYSNSTSLVLLVSDTDTSWEWELELLRVIVGTSK